MAQPYNKHSKYEDAELYMEMENVRSYAVKSLPLPEGYIYERWNKIPYDRIYQWHLNNGIPPIEIGHLLKKNPSGKYASIEPDGGLIVAVKKDNGGNIIDWIPLLASEAKHQESDVGNAIERVFKNYNTIKDIFMECEVFPYVCFGQGKGLESAFEQNKIIGGMGNDVNLDINIKDSEFTLSEAIIPVTHRLRKNITRKRGNFLVRREKWEGAEIYGRLLSAIKQSHSYFFPEMNNKKQTF